MPIEALSADQLRRRCDPAQFAFATTAELDAASTVLGQARAIDAIGFAIGIRQPGYNLYVAGPPGVGRRTLIEQLLGQAPALGKTLRDWCYVNNFVDAQRPIAIGMPAGRGNALRDDMARWVDELRDAIPAAFDTDEYRDRLGKIDAEFNERQQQAFEALGERSSAEGIALLRTPTGFSLAPLTDREIMSPEDFAKLDAERQREIGEKMRKYEGQIEEVVRELMQWRRERAEAIRALNEEVVEFAVGRITAELHARYEDLPEVTRFLDAARADVIANVDAFRKPAEASAEVDGMVVKSEADLHRYQVNVVIANDGSGAAPIVYEDHPSYANLVGRVEHVAQFGALVTNFTLIRSGALHRANGGYLLIDAIKLLAQPHAWDGLKRALRTAEIRIDSLAQVFSLVSTLSLEPQPIPLDVKVVLFGPEQLQPMLEAYDPDFGGLFKVAAEFADDVDWSDESVRVAATLIAGIARHRSLRAFSRDAVAAVIEECARMAGDATKLSAHTRSIEELLQEADYWAGAASGAGAGTALGAGSGERGNAGDDAAAGEKRGVVEAEHVARAAKAQIERSALTRERLHEAVLRGLIMIDTDGEVIGQVNGLMVVALGRASFALPGRITATTRFGKGELIDIHREIALSGAIHSKGVLTLSSFLATRFARRRLLSLSATLSFEQVYHSVDGDSASVAELCALLSSLSGVPLRQGVALTGSVNQHGQVQAIGGVNEKIEGFFDICNARGLTGSQAVIIPDANRGHLMLRADVVEAVRAGRFSVHAISHVDEAIELLTGLPAGDEDAGGGFPRDSVNGRVAAKLAQFEASALPRMMRIGRSGRENHGPGSS